VLDTNVLVSSLWRGPAWQVVCAWRDGRVGVLVSEDLLREYLSVLARFVSANDLAEWADTLTGPGRTTLVTPHELLHVIPHDPPDNRFLECAVSGAADAIVSQDRDLLRLGIFRTIPILTPSQALHRFALLH
jgi:putative PIN family toxin of toxin-antitoxin system